MLNKINLHFVSKIDRTLYHTNFHPNLANITQKKCPRNRGQKFMQLNALFFALSD
jgi:hypothetical protein